MAEELEHQRARITDLQARLYAEHQRGLLIVLRAMDTLEAIDPRYPEPGSGLPHAQLPT